MKSILLILVFLSSWAFASQKMVCISWMDHKTEIQEVEILENGYPTDLNFNQGDWAFSAQYFEGRINYITLNYKPLALESTARSISFPQNNLSAALTVTGMQSSLDCDIR